MITQITQHPSREKLAHIDNADLETIWREACWKYLSACFNRDTPGRIRDLAHKVLNARIALQRRGIGQ